VTNLRGLPPTDIPLEAVTLLVGPNNSGKSAALQALALWEAGLRRWVAKRSPGRAPDRRSGVAINRQDLIALPTPSAKLLWHDLQVRRVVHRTGGGHRTENVRIEMVVSGLEEDGRKWECGLEFDYANEESLYCRPLGTGRGGERMAVPPEAEAVRVAMLPPMSGLATTEPKWEPGRVDVLIGEGQTAQVLRNLCHRIAAESPEAWQRVVDTIAAMFGADLQTPKHVAERGEVTMAYRQGEALLDLTCAGRGMQQVLLLLAYLHANPGCVLLLDEPDAHLEVLRQREVYNLVTQVARELGGQVIAASHSEVVLAEAAERDSVVAFVGTPHPMRDRTQVLKSLRRIPWDDYYRAEVAGWVLYLEGSTDLDVLRAFARLLDHPVAAHLERPFVEYVGNSVADARSHLHGLREALPTLRGIALFDHLDSVPAADPYIEVLSWARREIENYFVGPDLLRAYARSVAGGQQQAEHLMAEAIEEIAGARRRLGQGDPWTDDVKVSDDVLPHVLREFHARLGAPCRVSKGRYHELTRFIPGPEALPAEVTEKLDAIERVARGAQPGT
jgi:hypothetical protein